MSLVHPLLLATALIAAPAFAQTTTPALAATAKDPNRVIGERVEEIGTRLGSKKVCMTAAQWAEQRQRDRDTVNDAQSRTNSR